MKDSNLVNLNSFMCSISRFFRVGGRIYKLLLLEEEKYFIILFFNYFVVKLLIDDVYRRELYVGVEYILLVLR